MYRALLNSMTLHRDFCRLHPGPAAASPGLPRLRGQQRTIWKMAATVEPPCRILRDLSPPPPPTAKSAWVLSDFSGTSTPQPCRPFSRSWTAASATKPRYPSSCCTLPGYHGPPGHEKYTYSLRPYPLEDHEVYRCSHLVREGRLSLDTSLDISTWVADNDLIVSGDHTDTIVSIVLQNKLYVSIADMANSAMRMYKNSKQRGHLPLPQPLPPVSSCSRDWWPIVRPRGLQPGDCKPVRQPPHRRHPIGPGQGRGGIFTGGGNHRQRPVHRDILGSAVPLV